jgi:hypothetical protein
VAKRGRHDVCGTGHRERHDPGTGECRLRFRPFVARGVRCAAGGARRGRLIWHQLRTSGRIRACPPSSGNGPAASPSRRLRLPSSGIEGGHPSAAAPHEVAGGRFSPRCGMRHNAEVEIDWKHATGHVRPGNRPRTAWTDGSPGNTQSRSPVRPRDLRARRLRRSGGPRPHGARQSHPVAHPVANESMKRERTRAAAATSSGATDSSGLWLMPSAHRTNSIATSTRSAIATAS